MSGEFSGFSLGELLRRARLLRDIAEQTVAIKDRYVMERWALKYEDAAREERKRISRKENAA